MIGPVQEAIDRLMIPATMALAPEGVEFQRTPGLADRLGGAMQDDGVDITDQAALADWMQSFNERPIEERDELLGPPRRGHLGGGVEHASTASIARVDHELAIRDSVLEQRTCTPGLHAEQVLRIAKNPTRIPLNHHWYVKM